MAAFWYPHFVFVPVYIDNIGMENEEANRAQALQTDAGSYNNRSGMVHQPQEMTTQQYTTTGMHIRQTQQGTGAGAPFMDMSAMADALPGGHTYHNHQPPTYSQQAGSSHAGGTMMFPYQHPQHYGASSQNYAAPFVHQLPSQYQHQHIRPQGMYPVGTHLPHGTYHYTGPLAYQQQIMASGATQFPQGMFPHTGGSYNGRGAAQLPSQHGFETGNTAQQFQQYVEDGNKADSNSAHQAATTLRGPPRKPKQSGHALWVGNLPPGTNVIDLKDHFSRDATDDIESVFLISKSNCAFVNYKTEQSCAAAMARFHDSRFHGVRLVCRLRRGSTSTPNAPVSPSTLTNVNAMGQPSTTIEKTTEERDTEDGAAAAVEIPAHREGETKVKEKYFIIKSLTVEDLERSVHTGIWATQSHNEMVLNRAYQQAENVYLIFSANKSGEYFGYARMESTIDDASTASVDVDASQKNLLPRHPTPTVADAPRTIVTPATATAPKGQIIDDSARGTIFWEAENMLAETESVSNNESALLDPDESALDDTASTTSRSPGENANQNTTFGKPFKISWISTDRLPFYRTRGLRNPWNTNREVKIARDGTELEPTVGRKLVGMFETAQSTPYAGGRAQHRQHQPVHYPLIVGQRMPPSSMQVFGPGQQGYGRPY